MWRNVILLCAFINSTIGVALPGDDATIADILGLSLRTPSNQPWLDRAYGENNVTISLSSTLQNRIKGQYSHVDFQEHLISWSFGKPGKEFNISVASCIKKSDVVGVYEFADGTLKYDATAGDIIADLGLQSQSRSRAEIAAQTLKNARAAYAEAQAYLFEDVLTKDTSLATSIERRAVNFESEGRILGLVFKTVYGLGFGAVAVQAGASIMHVKATKGQLAAGALAGGGGVMVFTIIDILVDEGALTGLEPQWMERSANYIANAFMAKLRGMIRRARRTPQGRTGPSLTESELVAHLEDLDNYNAWATETTPLSAQSFPIVGICDMV